MNATSLLEDQHRVIEALLAQLESFSGHPAAILGALANNLGAHMAIEQDLFYPAIAAVDEELINESYEEHALVEVRLLTGRKHQIRLQLAEIGCPILGDHKYGSRAKFTGPGIALHAARLVIEHPTTKERLDFRARLPKSWKVRD